MIINNLYVGSVAILKLEAYAPLVVDAYAVLSDSVALECFQSIARRHFQGFNGCCGVQLLQLPDCHAFDVDESLYSLA